MPTTVKEAIAKFEAAKSVTAADAEKVHRMPLTLPHRAQLECCMQIAACAAGGAIWPSPSH